MPTKPSSPPPSARRVNHVVARNAALVNQFATPGLGSLMARRWLAGSSQLVLAVVGCVMMLVWFVKVMIQYYGQITGNVTVRPVGWIGLTGGILFVIAWFWSLVTSISLFFEARRNAAADLLEQVQAPPGSVPPKL